MEIIIEFKNEEGIKGFTPETIKYFYQLSEEQLTNEIKKETPVLTGNARGSWTPKLTASGVHITTSVNYMPFLEEGTGIYNGGKRIFPKNAQAFHAVINGEDVFFTNMRGQPGHHMAKKGAEHFKPKIPNLFRLAMQKTGAK